MTDLGFAAPKYAKTAFPRYRFIPGEAPHPTAHPDGHSYLPPGASHPRVIYYAPEDWPNSEDYLFGCDLYNHGYWWEAHEAWEGLWQLTDKQGLQGRFLQSLIQVSARHLKLHTQKTRGIESLGRSSMGHIHHVLENLAGYMFMGLDFKQWTDQVSNYYDANWTRRTGRLSHDPNTYPYILLKDENDRSV